MCTRLFFMNSGTVIRIFQVTFFCRLRRHSCSRTLIYREWTSVWPVIMRLSLSAHLSRKEDNKINKLNISDYLQLFSAQQTSPNSIFSMKYDRYDPQTRAVFTIYRQDSLSCRHEKLSCRYGVNTYPICDAPL